MKNMTLGQKIGTGFGFLILIAAILGGIAVYEMRLVSAESAKLAKEYAPEVEVANEVERHSLRTMYAMRGYAYSEEDSYLETGMKNLTVVKKGLEEALALAKNSPHLVKLKESVPEAQKGVATYEQLANETVDKNKVLADLRKTMDSAAATYMTNCFEFLDSQNIAMMEEIIQGAGEAKLKERLSKITLVNDIIDIGNATRIGNFKSQATRDPELLTATITNFQKVEKMFEQLRPITRKDVNIRQLDATQKAGTQYEAAMSQFLNEWLAREELNKARGFAGEAVLASAEATSSAGIKHTLEIAGEADNVLKRASTIMIIGLVVALVSGVSMAVLIILSITRPVNNVINGLTEASAQVSSASVQVSSASQSLAEGASEQAASIEETSSSLEEMSSMTKQNANHANEAKAMMADAKHVVEKVNQHMGGMAKAVNEISASSEETSKIIKTIDEIAFQTNLLALNAAVEAARAGEAGAGFAVVADEVRSLAMRAAEAAKNTSDLIENTLKAVSNGSELTQSTIEAFKENMEIATKVANLVEEIAAASNEQSAGIEQVNQAVADMDKVTQQNAANAEESASASEQLNAQAQQMQKFVSDLMNVVGRKQNGGNGNDLLKGASGYAPKEMNLPLVLAAKKSRKGNGGRENSPEAVIPMDDADFNDF